MDDPATAAVALPPPLLFTGALVLGLALGREPRSMAASARAVRAMGGVALGAGVTIGIAALAAIKGVGSNVSPYRPTTALATSGIFRLSRNPAYVGMTSIYLGLAMRARSLPALTLLPIVLALLDRLAVDREERYLETRFGDEYRAYRQTVPRWF